MSDPVRLHIGGVEPRAGWILLNIQPGPGVDHVGSCTSLPFPDASIDEIYASHVLEHLSFVDELPQALREMQRVLKPGGVARISVPDFEIICSLFASPHFPKDQRYALMTVAFGGQTDPHDFHKVGLTYDLLGHFALHAGFTRMRRVPEFGLFEDSSGAAILGVPLSLNVEITK